MVKVLFNIQGKYSLNKTQIIKAINLRLKQLKLSDDIELSVVLVDPKTMAKLNKQYRGKSGPTDVLSFSMRQPQMPDGVVRLGEVVICPEKLTDKIDKMIIHGLNHLLGIHHD